MPLPNQLHRSSLGMLMCVFGILFTLNSYSQEYNNITSNYPKIDSLIKRGNFEDVLELLISTDYLNKKGLTIQERLRLQLFQARAHYGLEETDEAMSLLLQGFDETNSSATLQEVSFEYALLIGRYLANNGNLAESNQYYQMAIKRTDATKNTRELARIYLAIGKNYFNKREIDSAIYTLEKVSRLKDSIANKDLIAESYNSLGIIANSSQEFEKAEAYFEGALKIHQSLKDTINIAGGLMNLSSFYYSTEQYVQAEKTYGRVLALTETMHSESALKIKENALYNLAYTADELGNYKEAFSYLDQATILTDSISAINVERNISEIVAKYNVAKEAQKTEEEKSKRLRAQFLNYGIMLTSLALLLIGYIFYRNYRLKQRSRIEKIENESHTKIINATIDAKEKERKSIAETLHDSVSALLSSANLHLQATQSQLKNEVPQEVGKAQRIINEASVKIRDLSHELISSVLLKFGLAFAINDVCQKYSNSEISLHSDDKKIERYDQDFEIKIYNIIEEMINNILKHSKASNATIMLEHKTNDKLSIRISDDGVGFDPLKVKQKDGLGLSHIQARIKVMKGVFNIQSAKGSGTSIFIEVPVKKKRSA